MTFTEKLNGLMVKKGINRKQLSEQSGIPYMTIINFYEKGTENVKLSTLKKLAMFFDVSLDYIADDNAILSSKATPQDYEIPIDPSKWHPIPVYDGIAAGSPIFADDSIAGYEYIDCTDPLEHFILMVHGDSMINARIYDGDRVLIRRQSCAEDGQVVACLVNGDSATLKRYHRQGDTIILQPENSSYAPILLPTSEFDSGYARILGVVEQVMFKL